MAPFQIRTECQENREKRREGERIVAVGAGWNWKDFSWGATWRYGNGHVEWDAILQSDGATSAAPGRPSTWGRHRPSWPRCKLWLGAAFPVQSWDAVSSLPLSVSHHTIRVRQLLKIFIEYDRSYRWIDLPSRGLAHGSSQSYSTGKYMGIADTLFQFLSRLKISNDKLRRWTRQHNYYPKLQYQTSSTLTHVYGLTWGGSRMLGLMVLTGKASWGLDALWSFAQVRCLESLIVIPGTSLVRSRNA